MAHHKGRRREYGSDYYDDPEYRERNRPWRRSDERSSSPMASDRGYGQMADHENERWRRQDRHETGWAGAEEDYAPRGRWSGGYATEGDRFGGLDESMVGGHYGGQGGRYGAALAGEMYRSRDPYRGYGPSRDYADHRGRSYRDRDREGEHDRGFWDRATDEVASWFGDEDAEQRRRMDHRGRGPRGYVRSDERIREDVHDRLTDDWRIDASDVEVEVRGGEVTLNGEVYSRGDKRLAEDIVEDVSGVAHVQNNLRVKKWEEPGKTGVTL